MASKATAIETSATMLINRWEQVGNKLAGLAEEFPAEAYEFKPTDGVRTVGDVLRHVAFWNLYVAATAREQKAEEAANELPKAEYPTKAKVLEALRKSVADAVSALKEHASGQESKTCELLAPFLEHTSEHYGQLAVYARLKGLVPPASRA